MQILYPDEEGQDVEVHVNMGYNGYKRGSRTDSYFFIVYQSAIEYCIEMLSNLNNIQVVLAHFRTCEDTLGQKAPLHEEKIFCFFLDPKEASN